MDEAEKCMHWLLDDDRSEYSGCTHAAQVLSAELDALRKDAERLDWLTARLEYCEIDGADPLDHFQTDDGEGETLPVLWRRAIDAARGKE